jgi:hypothetical protein
MDREGRTTMKGLLQSTASVLVLAMLGTAAIGTVSIANESDHVSKADCEMQQAIETRAEKAGQESSDASAKSYKYIQSEKQRAESEKKNGKYEILANFDRTGWKMDVPEVTVRSREVKLPTVHTAMRTTSINIPVPGQCKVGSTKIPEFRDLRMTMKEHDILAPCMTTKQAKLDLPQFTAGTTSVQVPQVTVEMKTREFSLNLPQFTERTPDHEMRKHENNIEQEEGRLANTLAAITEKNIAAATKEVEVIWQKEHDAAFQALDAAEMKALGDLAAGRAQLQASVSAAKASLQAAGAPPDATSELERQSQQANATLETTEAKAKEIFAEQRTLLEKEFEQLKQKYLGPVNGTASAACER